MNTYHLFFSNLANPLRTEIIAELKKNPSSVSELVEKLNVEQSKLSHALKSLKNCSIVEDRKEGKKRIYYLNCATILPILKIIDKHEKKFCAKCKALGRKKK